MKVEPMTPVEQAPPEQIAKLDSMSSLNTIREFLPTNVVN